MRGKAHDLFRQATKMGITPAYAGKSDGERARTTKRKDHPRVCGEKFDNPKNDNSE